MELVILCLFLFPVRVVGEGRGERYKFQQTQCRGVSMCRPMVCFLESVGYLVRGLRHVPAACVITSAVSSVPSFWEFYLLFPFIFLGIHLCSVIFVCYLFIYLYLLIFGLLPSTKRNTLTIKPTRCTNFSNLFLEQNSTCFGQVFCPSFGVLVLYTQQQVYVIKVLLTACQRDPANKRSHNHYCSVKAVCITCSDCVRSLRFPACNAHAPYCHLWPVRMYNIFLRYKRHDFRGGRKLNIKCVF